MSPTQRNRTRIGPLALGHAAGSTSGYRFLEALQHAGELNWSVIAPAITVAIV